DGVPLLQLLNIGPHKIYKSKFMDPGVARDYKEKLNADSLIDIMRYEDTLESSAAAIREPVKKRVVHSYHQDFIVFNDAQNEAR
ncbi:hypothetical protein, partial [Legionella sp. CNM-4043-24]|uniref:hypothetical protein n=1 Tax=Legionella sp. CNM-4043-24 TaxID=3421646 RepID=UPI00403A8FCD